MTNLHLVSLGCARNQVDSEMMLGRLRDQGWTLVDAPENAHVIVINTCSFIEAATSESIDTILALAEHKKTGVCRKLIVAGCLPERYRGALSAELPEVDLFIGTGAYDQISAAVQKDFPPGACLLPNPNATCLTTASEPRLVGDPHVAYLKIAEGCNSRCTYCIIPTLRGNHRSRPFTDIITEAQTLINAGIKELVLVAQDTTNYGGDLIPPRHLNHLLMALADLSPHVWIRFLYGHPSHLDTDVIRTVSERENLCAYFDLPIQHASDPILKRMGRDYGQATLYRLFDDIRSAAPDAALRTTVMVGFPGETDADIDALIKMMDAVRFDNLGVFTYSDADDLPSHQLANPVPEKIAQQRLDTVMAHQRNISEKNNEKYWDRVLTILLEEPLEENLFLGRHALQAPEVDGVTYVTIKDAKAKAAPGQFVNARVVDTLTYDLVTVVES